MLCNKLKGHFQPQVYLIIEKLQTPRNNQCYLGDKVERESNGREGTFDNCVMKTTGRRVLHVTCRHEVYLLWYF